MPRHAVHCKWQRHCKMEIFRFIYHFTFIYIHILAYTCIYMQYIHTHVLFTLRRFMPTELAY
jgi:hypothetical protein